MVQKVIKFSASWCAPCKQMTPIFHKISKIDKYRTLQFIEYDIEKDEEGIELVETFNIKSVPTVVCVNENGQVVRKIIGLVQENTLTEVLNDIIDNGL
jgi:thioredoxin 1